MKRSAPISGVAIVLTLLVVNFLASRHFARLDLTANREYTLAAATKETLRGLQDVITIREYFSRDLPPQLTSIKRGVTDILGEYQRYGAENIQVEVLDPQANPQTEREVMILGINPLEVNVVKKDKQELARVFMGLVLLYGDDKEIIQIDPREPTRHLEEWLTGGIVKLTRDKQPKIGWAAPTTRPEGSGFNIARKFLEERYGVENIDAKSPQLDPTKLDAVVLVSPQDATPELPYALDQYLGAGGKVVLFLDRVQVEERGFSGTKQASGLEPLLEAYGVQSTGKLVADASANYASFQSQMLSQMFTYTVPYPFWPALRGAGLDREHPVVSKLELLTLPWATALEVAATVPAGLTAKVLARTSPKSGLLAGEPPYTLDPESAAGAIPANPGAGFPLIVAVDGQFPDAFAAGGLARPVSAEGKPALPRGTTPGRLIVIGTAHLLEDRFVGQRQFAEGVAFFANVIDHCTIGDALIGIRSRPVTARPISRDFSEADRALIRYANLIGVPLLVVGAGLFCLALRRKRWAALRAVYGQ
ncbi:MAG: GldG family protein [Deltaproteobacteria bacterium]|nr:GldG family protein [Deltaproteobacteria bacterium]